MIKKPAGRFNMDDNNFIGFDDDGNSIYDCWNCGGTGFSHHDCGEDCCCCADPEDNVICDACNGYGSYLVEKQQD